MDTDNPNFYIRSMALRFKKQHKTNQTLTKPPLLQSDKLFFNINFSGLGYRSPWPKFEPYALKISSELGKWKTFCSKYTLTNKIIKELVWLTNS